MTENRANFRAHTSTLNRLLFDEIVFKTTISKKEELWLFLHSVSEVRDGGFKHFQESGHKKYGLEKKWKLFRSYIRQGKNYWEAAEKTDDKSSPMLYYYSFMNLIKAYLVLKGRWNNKNKDFHGLIDDKSNKWTRASLEDKFLKTKDSSDANNVFSLYYKEIFSENCFEKVEILNLFGYLMDISLQSVNTIKKDPNCTSFKHIFAINKKTKDIWLDLAVRRVLSPEKEKLLLKFLKKDFELVNRPNNVNRDFLDFFNIDPNFESIADYDFYEQKNVLNYKDEPFFGLYYRDLVQGFSNGNLRNICFPDYNCDGNSGMINVPLVIDGKEYPINEEIAIYVIMFFLSHLVRYKPDYLDNLLETNEYWLIKSFIKTCPQKFLNAITSKIMGYSILLRSI